MQDLTCEVWLRAPGTAYPYRIYVSVPKGHALHGRAHEEIPNIVRVESGSMKGEEFKIALDESGVVEESDEWSFGREGAAFYGDIEWARNQAEVVAEHLSRCGQLP